MILTCLVFPVPDSIPFTPLKFFNKKTPVPYMGRMLSWFHPNYNALYALSLDIFNADQRAYLLLFQYPAPRWFSTVLEQETFQPMSLPFCVQSTIYSSFSMPFNVFQHCNYNTKNLFPCQTLFIYFLAYGFFEFFRIMQFPDAFKIRLQHFHFPVPFQSCQEGFHFLLDSC